MLTWVVAMPFGDNRPKKMAAALVGGVVIAWFTTEEEEEQGNVFSMARPRKPKDSLGKVRITLIFKTVKILPVYDF